VSEGAVGAGNGSNCSGLTRTSKPEVCHCELVEALAVLRPSGSPRVADDGETARSSGVSGERGLELLHPFML